MPFPLIALVFAGLSFAANSLLNRRPKQQALKPVGLSEFSVPTTDETRSIPYLAGTLPIVPNISFFGDLSTTPITQFVKTSLLGTGERQQLGFRYNVGMELGLCHGPNVRLKKITVDDKEIFNGDLIGVPGTVTILQEALFGGEGPDGDGGINVILDFYEGNSSQIANPYMVTQYARQNGHRDVCYAVWRGPSGGSIYQGGQYVSGGGYIGKIPQIRPMKFYCQRIPNVLTGGTHLIGTDDANPAHALFEVMTSRIYGSGCPSGKLNSTSFTQAAQTLFDEAFGCSIMFERVEQVRELILDLLEMIDAVIYADPTDGLINLKLIRNDYDPNTILHLTDDEVGDIKSYSRGSWDETQNELRLQYTNRADDYNAKYALAQDLANAQIRDAVDSAQMAMPFITNSTLAQKVAYRECRKMSLPLAKATLGVKRHAARLTPGSVFKWSTTKTSPTISNKIMRVLKADYGRVQDTAIELAVVEDVFAMGDAIYSVVTESQAQNPVTLPLASNPIYTAEQPYWYAGAAFKPWSMARQPNGSHIAHDIHISIDGGASYVLKDPNAIFTPVGTFFANYSQNTNPVDAAGFEIINVAGMQNVFAPAAANDIAANGAGLMLFEDTGEIAAFESINYSTVTNRYTVQNVWRGLLDSTIAAHGVGTRIWFFTMGQSILGEAFAISPIRLKHLTRTARGTLAIGSAVAQIITNNNRALKPYPPTNVRINGNFQATTHTGNVTLLWSERNRLTQTVILKQTDPSVTPEASTTYTLVIKNNLNVVIRTQTLISSPTYTYTTAQELLDNAGVLSPNLTWELYAVVGGFNSTIWRKTTARV